MAIPLYLNKKQIEQVCQLVIEDMNECLGYIPIIREISEKKGEDCRFQIGGLIEEDYSEEIEEYFNECLLKRIKEVAKVFGESGIN